MKKEEFKDFVKKNPSLIKYVRDGSMDWQKFYEIYDLYGEEESAWKDYIRKEEVVEKVATVGTTTLGVGEVVKWLKSVDLDGLQEGIGNVQRILGVVQDFGKKDTPKTTKPAYKPRPLYKHFED